MSHSRFARAPGFAALAVSVSFCAVAAQAGPVETIYSAENALYGAGYDIGKADGWMDNTLRSAIRQFQSEHDELQANGNLDPQTLSALGIAPESDSTVSGNDVADRKAAMAALGLSDKRFDSGRTDRAVAEAPAPEVQPEPEPEIQQQPDPEPEAEVELVSQEPPENEVVASRAQAPEQEPEDTVGSEPVPDAQEVTVAAREEPVEAPAEEPAAEPERAARAPEPVAQTEPAAQSEPQSEPVVAIEAEFQLPDEPTGAGSPEVSESAEPAEVSKPEKASVSREAADSTEVASTPTASEPEAPGSSSGGFFASLFDFLFGWLI